MDPLRYLTGRSTHPGPRQNERLLRHRLALSKELSHKDLVGHFGCVNALEFSHGLGSNLASGGDDRRVLFWDVEKALNDIGRPTTMKGEHNSNIFCLAFDVDNTTLFSGGNDEQVIVHDIATGVTKDVYLHEDAVYGLSPDPSNPNVFASSCDDGRVLIYDIRDSTAEPFCLANYTSSMHSVMYNPVEPRLLATANAKEGVGLWDVRKPKTCVLRYGGAYSQQSCMSVRFNQLGDQIIALRRRLPPVLYKIDSNTPVCEFDHSGYYNSCTMKSVAFAGDLDQYVISGSDEFNLYMWAIPEDLSERVFINSAHMVLKGHRSIVNQVRFNISNHLIVSSGVEKVIKAWSPFKFPTKQTSDGDRKKVVRNRPVYTHEEYINLVLETGHVMSHDYSHESTEEDPRMIAFFDSLVQRELEGISSDDSLSSNEEALYSRIVQLSQSDIDSDDSLNDPLEQNSDGEPNFSPFTIAFASVMASQASDGNDRFPRLNNALNNAERDSPSEQDTTGTQHSSSAPSTDTHTDRGTSDISSLVRKKKLELRNNVQKRLKDCSAKLSDISNEDLSDSSEPDLCETNVNLKNKPTAVVNETGLTQASKHCLEQEKECRKQVQVRLKRLRNLRQRVLNSDSENSDTDKQEVVCLTSTPDSRSNNENEPAGKVKFKKFRKRNSDVNEDKVRSRASPDLGPFLQRAGSNTSHNIDTNSTFGIPQSISRNTLGGSKNTVGDTKNTVDDSKNTMGDAKNTVGDAKNTVSDSSSKKGKKVAPEESTTGKGRLRHGRHVESNCLKDRITEASIHSMSEEGRVSDGVQSSKTSIKSHGCSNNTEMNRNHMINTITGRVSPNSDNFYSSNYENCDVKVSRKRSLSTDTSERQSSNSNIARKVTRHRSLSPPISKRKLSQTDRIHVTDGQSVSSSSRRNTDKDQSIGGNYTQTHSKDDASPSCSYSVHTDNNIAGPSEDLTNRPILNNDACKVDRVSAVDADKDTISNLNADKDNTVVSSRTKRENQDSGDDDQPTWSEFKRFKNKVERARHRYNEHRKQKKRRHSRDER